ncbi:MAG: PQQ-binding-like beta-propeller repeat protein [Paludibacter sp.]|nr:PQQ-binding-like beta-propeller repeat protein [Paludibacter sp.]
MKKIKVIAILLATFVSIYAADFKTLSSIDLPFSPNEIVYDHTSDFQYFLCSNKLEMLMFDGNTGKILWQMNFQKETGAKKIANQFWNKNANVILVFEEDTKKAVSTKYFIDGKSGKLLWKSNNYVSDFGKYELSNGFKNYFDTKTNGVLLPTKEKIDFVNVMTGEVIWSKAFDIAGKARDFDCFIMEYYNLVKVITGKDSEIFLTTDKGIEVADIEKYYDKKKALKNASRASYLEIPEKNCYVIMKGKESVLLDVMGIIGGGGTGAQSWKMKFSAYEMNTDRLLWEKEHFIAQGADWITYQPYVAMMYADGKLFVEHEPNLKTNSGLTVLDIYTGEKSWECNYTTSSMKGVTTTVLTPFPAPDPVVYNGSVYVMDNFQNRFISYNLETGNKQWESEKMPTVQKIPAAILTDGVIILPLGAAERKIQKTETASEFCFSYHTSRVRVVCSGSGKSRKQYTYKYIYDDKDSYGIRAFNPATGKLLWSNETIAKAAKDKFSFVASTQLVDGKLYCATNKNLFILDPKTGAVLGSAPISKEKVGDIWGMTYFDNQNQFILNCANGVVKVDAANARVLGSLKTPNVSGLAVSEMTNADDPYLDYAIFTKGDVKKMEYKEFAAIDLEKMSLRGVFSADVLFDNNPHFADGGEKFFVANGKNVKIFATK